MVRIGIIGAAGLSGIELLNLLSRHSKATVKLVTSTKYQGKKVSEVFPELYQYSLTFNSNETNVLDCDVVFLAVPNQASLELVPKLLGQGIRVIDLSGAYRLAKIDIFEKFYKLTHTYPELLKEAVFGLPEFLRHKISGARLVANPGCYSTCALLGILPLSELLGDIDQPPVIDAKSGVSGAGGRVEDDSLNYVSVNENFKAYKVFSHQHQPEIQQYLNELSPFNSDINGEVIFTPHLLPVNRGILSTIYIHFRESVDGTKVLQRFSEFADKQKFVEFLGKSHFPDIKMASHTNRCMIGIECDQSGQNWIIVSSLDNLIKGAAGQAIQNMNIMFGLEESLGLE